MILSIYVMLVSIKIARYVSCYDMLCYAILWYDMLCHVMLCYANLRNIILQCGILCYVMYVTPNVMYCHIMLCDIMLCCIVSSYGMLCHGMFYCVELCSVRSVVLCVAVSPVALHHGICVTSCYATQPYVNYIRSVV